MALPIEVEFPESILEKGNSFGYEWVIAANYRGCRCGYICIPQSHPLFGTDFLSEETWRLKVHGGITYGERDTENKDKWWLGFDCGHGCDAPDLSLITDIIQFAVAKNEAELLLGHGRTVKDQDYVRQECIKLSKQFKAIVFDKLHTKNETLL